MYLHSVSIIPFQYNEKQCKITPLYINLVNIIINLIKDSTRYKGFVTGFVIFQIAEEAKTESLSRDILSFQLVCGFDVISLLATQIMPFLPIIILTQKVSPPLTISHIQSKE